MGVFRVEQTEDGAIARFVPVETGLQDGDLTQIVSPPLQGQVVTLGLHLLDDGKAVEISRVREP